MSDRAVGWLCDTAVTVGFFGMLCVLGACFVATVWIMARSIERTLDLGDDEEAD